MDGSSAGLNRVDKHFWLTRSVARVMGVSLSKAMQEGRLSPVEYREMVARCQAGGCQTICLRWLARQTGAVAEAPDHCMHRDLLARLRPD